jgi:hypothetical protein
MSRLAILLALAACTLRPYDSGATDTDATSSTTATPDPTTGPETTTGPPLPTTSSTTSTTTAATSTGHTPPAPDLGGPQPCDQWLEDCPEGQKCAFDRDYQRVCVPLVPTPDGLGEPCEYLGDGVDTCDLHAVCWDGACVAQCSGPPRAPTCDLPGTLCLFFGVDTINLCVPACDPLAPTCPNGQVCVANPSSPELFVCITDASGREGQTFDPCEYANACDPGLQCADPLDAAECDPEDGGCCLPFCDLTAPNTCPGTGLQCLPWHDEVPAPPGLQDVGACRLPE